jgi:hypothetical protein
MTSAHEIMTGYLSAVVVSSVVLLLLLLAMTIDVTQAAPGRRTERGWTLRRLGAAGVVLGAGFVAIGAARL